MWKIKPGKRNTFPWFETKISIRNFVYHYRWRGLDTSESPFQEQLTYTARNLTKLQQRRQEERLKHNRLQWAKQQLRLHVHHFFLYISPLSVRTTTWNSQFFLVDGLKNWNDKAINLFTIPLWTRARSPLFSSSLTHVPCFQFTERLGMRAKKDAKSIFQRRFHWRLCFRIVRSLLDCILIVLWFLYPP